MFQWLTDVVARHGLGVGLLAVFLGGLLLNLTPCVYPMIPVTMAFFTSQAAGRLQRATELGVWYVLGMALTYATLGWLAATSGLLFGAWLQHPAVLIAVAGLIVTLSLSMFGVYEFQLPQMIVQRVGQASAGRWGALLMGLVMGVVAAPCIGPFIISLLLVISRLENPAAGFLLLFMLGVGLGSPYLLLGVLAPRLQRLPKSGEWLVWSKKLLGVVLLGLALYFIRPILPGWLLGVAAVVWLITGGAYLGWLERSRGRGRGFVWTRRIIGSALIGAALVVLWPKPPVDASVAWAPYSDAALERAQRDHQPALVDVYADWCLPCVEMDHTTFRHADVAKALSTFVTLRVDVTREVPAQSEGLIERYKIFGAPTILFFDHTGKERQELRVMGFMPPEEFLEHLTRVRSEGN